MLTVVDDFSRGANRPSLQADIHGRALRSMVAIFCPLPLPSPVERLVGPNLSTEAAIGTPTISRPVPKLLYFAHC